MTKKSVKRDLKYTVKRSVWHYYKVHFKSVLKCVTHESNHLISSTLNSWIATICLSTVFKNILLRFEGHYSCTFRTIKHIFFISFSHKRQSWYHIVIGKMLLWYCQICSIASFRYFPNLYPTFFVCLLIALHADVETE